MDCKLCIKNGSDCVGPCYDYCGCLHCWRGWSDFSWTQKLKNRLQYILSECLDGGGRNPFGVGSSYKYWKK